MNGRQKNGRADIYAQITGKIVCELERGVRPWTQPWAASKAGGAVTRPLRHNGEPYSGMNVLLLWSEGLARGYAPSTWMTFKQSIELGGAVRRGETGATVIYASRFTKTQTDSGGSEVERDIPFLKAYTVFNVAQIDGLPERYYTQTVSRLDALSRLEYADRFFSNTGAILRHGGTQAYYSPSGDFIQMPPFESFRDAASYAATLSHELGHWTARAGRVGRDLSRYSKDKSERAREELIAELTSCFVCADLGIVPELEPRPDHASYLQSWLTVLSNDKRAIFQAAAHAQRAVAYLHSLQPSAGEDREAA